jgi:hypothetical protein
VRVRIDRRVVEVVAVCALAGSLTACSDNLARRDAMTPWSGDDVARNAAVQTINPWPNEAFDRRATTVGSKAEDAMKIYHMPPPAPAAAPSTTDAAAPAANPGSAAVATTQ